MAGADVAMMTSALLKLGPKHVTGLLASLEQWLLQHEYISVVQLKGSMSQKAVADPAAFERANYMKVLQAYKQ
jgi:dihydroorotate dehydrogenase (fumarate)